MGFFLAHLVLSHFKHHYLGCEKCDNSKVLVSARKIPEQCESDEDFDGNKHVAKSPKNLMPKKYTSS